MMMDLEKLEVQIKLSTRVVVCAAILVPAVYIVWFLMHHQTISEVSSDWGVFGDFVGGLLNPLIAFFAFYWLIKSIRIQKEELTETRKALRDTSMEQKAQTELAILSLELNKLNLQLSYLNSKIEFERTYLLYVLKEATAKGGDKTVVSCIGMNVAAKDLIPDLQNKIGQLEYEQNQISFKIEELNKTP